MTKWQSRQYTTQMDQPSALRNSTKDLKSETITFNRRGGQEGASDLGWIHISHTRVPMSAEKMPRATGRSFPDQGE